MKWKGKDKHNKNTLDIINRSTFTAMQCMYSIYKETTNVWFIIKEDIAIDIQSISLRLIPQLSFDPIFISDTDVLHDRTTAKLVIYSEIILDIRWWLRFGDAR